MRYLKPKEGSIVEIEASSPEEAVNNFHFEYRQGLFATKINSTDNEPEDVVYALCEVDGEEMFCRAFMRSIKRRGGIPHPQKRNTEEDIANELMFPKEWLRETWFLEEDEWE